MSDSITPAFDIQPAESVGLYSLEKFAMNRVVQRDLKRDYDTPTAFPRFNKDEINRSIGNPSRNWSILHDAVVYIYNSSSHFKRLIQYFVALNDLSYYVSPYKLDTAKANPKSVNRNYRKVLNLLQNMDIKNQFPEILTCCLREDTYYGTFIVSNDNITLKQLPFKYCRITTVEGNVCNVTFDFSYFDSRLTLLEYYTDEFKEKYERYKSDRANYQYQELDSPWSFAIKCNRDELRYPIPPFASLLREVYDLEDYKKMKLTKTDLENYAILVMTLGIDIDGNWQIDLPKAKEFWRNLDSVLPEEIGSILTPMPINKISFEKTHNDADTVAEAEQELFSAAGVSSLLFNNEKATSNALLLSIKADQAITYSIVKSIEQMVNRIIWSQNYGKNFKVTFLDCSPFNRQEVADAALKSCQYGFPRVSVYCAALGMSQDELDGMNFLEDRVLNIKSRFVPLQSSATMSSDTEGAGRPEAKIGEISDNGEIAKEQL